ncbi:thermosome [Methanosalsum zhilinae DSM 4017]|uniref:Thermosome n=1 Tax=Methanosalsum zhilinae (strain DSM 4017 / NBRC 107636 / OCM 62 / WeN5) TaxID=679901 RepID=F7XLG7_METZD|nr:thermosome subunit alpha [Methanosalsum zhilinae]AEH60630.1 thermosome [Methanosalsum zhilinae DSM 4017]
MATNYNHGGQPVYIMGSNREQTKGRDAVSMNIRAAKAVSDLVKSTLGPISMDKMLVNPIGDIIITNDGATILDEMDIEHPTAKMIVEVARTQDDIAGDGTTSAAVLAGTLLEKAQELMEKGVHATSILKGYRLATEKAMQALDEYKMTIDPADKEVLKNIAVTSITGKASESYSAFISGICVDAVLAVQDDGNVNIDDDILIVHDKGQKITDSELVEGVVLTKKSLHPNMPKRIENARIALVDSPIEIEKTGTTSKIEIKSADQMEAFLKEEDESFKKMVDAIVRSGANAVFCSKGIDDHAVHYLQKHGIYATRRVKESEMKSLSRATGARLVKKVHEIDEKDLGTAGLLEQIGDSDDAKTFVKDCENARTVTIVLRGGTEHVTENIERVFDDALHVVASTVEDSEIVAGGGASEIETAAVLRSYAPTVGGREQLAISAFADSIEILPRILAENAGLDGVNMLLKLRSDHHEIKHAGLDVYTGEVVNMLDRGVVDPLRVKKQAIKSASEAAAMVLRVDDVLRAEKRDMMDVNPEHNIHNYDASGMM